MSAAGSLFLELILSAQFLESALNMGIVTTARWYSVVSTFLGNQTWAGKLRLEFMNFVLITHLGIFKL